MKNMFRSLSLGRKILACIFLIAVLIAFFGQFHDFLRLSFIEIGQFLKFRGDYELARLQYPGQGLGVLLGFFAPPGSRVELLTDMLGLIAVGVRYGLYPIRVQDPPDFQVDLRTRMGEAPQGWRTIYARDFERNIYVRPGQAINPPPSGMPTLSLARTAGISFLLALMNIVTGHWILRLFRVSPGNGRAWYLSTAYLAGYFVLTAVLWIFLMAGGRCTTAQIMLLWAAVIGLLGWASLRFSGGNSAVSHPEEPEAKTGGPGKAMVLTAAFFLSCIVLVFFLDTISVPVRDWDAMSHWLLKSKIIFYQQNLDLSYAHLQLYPLLWPLNIAAQFTLTGGMYDQLAQWTSAFFFLAFLAQLWQALSLQRMDRHYLAFGLALFLVFAFNFESGNESLLAFVCANAENVLMAYLTASLVALLGLARSGGRGPFFYLSVFMLAGLAAAKFEGMVTALILIASWWVCFGRNDGAGIRRAFGFLTVFVLPAVWLLWGMDQGYRFGSLHFREPLTLSRLVILLKNILIRVRHNNLILVFAGSFALLRLFPNRRSWNKREFFLLIVFVLLTLLSICGFAGWPEAKIQTGLTDAFSRMFLHASPVLLCLYAARRFGREDL